MKAYSFMKFLIAIVCCSGLILLNNPAVFAARQNKNISESSNKLIYKNDYLAKYKNNQKINYILIVEPTGRTISEAVLTAFKKDNNSNWAEFLQCNAFIGLKGTGKHYEGDKKTPLGDYGISIAFGAKKNPGTKLKYIKLTDTMYWCGDSEYYNQFVDTVGIDHSCSDSEHLIDYIPHYNYAMALDYNKENDLGKGAGIFLHCFGYNPYTLGCISISEENMKKILCEADKNVRICICLPAERILNAR